MFKTLAAQLGESLLKRQLRLVTAESCTGGGIASALTDIAGASAWFERGFVTYSLAAKIESLGVNPDILAQYGAVSEQTAAAMAEGALLHSHAHIALSVTGLAGPTGGSISKPVGTVYLGIASAFFATQILHCIFNGTREQIREQSIQHALEKLYELTHRI